MKNEDRMKTIPANLTECVTALKEHLSNENLEKIRDISLDEFRTTAHFDLGMWIRNSFLYSSDSLLAKYLKGKGVFHEDDMSSLILTALHNDLTAGAFDEDELLSRFVPHSAYGKEKQDN